MILNLWACRQKIWIISVSNLISMNNYNLSAICHQLDINPALPFSFFVLSILFQIALFVTSQYRVSTFDSLKRVVIVMLFIISPFTQNFHSGNWLATNFTSTVEFPVQNTTDIIFLMLASIFFWVYRCSWLVIIQFKTLIQIFGYILSAWLVV